MSCLDPPVTKQELAETGEDDDWMCRVCDARVDAFYALNAIASRHVDAATATWHDVFPEEGGSTTSYLALGCVALAIAVCAKRRLCEAALVRIGRVPPPGQMEEKVSMLRP